MSKSHQTKTGEAKASVSAVRMQGEPSQMGGTVEQMPPGLLLQRAQASPRTLSPAHVTSLQRSVGNQAVAQLLGRATPSHTQQASTHGQFSPAPDQGVSKVRLQRKSIGKPGQASKPGLAPGKRLASTKPAIQRSIFSKLFSKKQEENPFPIPVEYTGFTAIESQNKAEELTDEASRLAANAQNQAANVRSQLDTNLYSSDQEHQDMLSAGALEKHGGAKHKTGRHGARRMQKADQKAIFSQTAPIAELNQQVKGLVREVRAESPGRFKLGINERTATLNLGKAVKAKGLADQMTQLAANLSAGDMEKEVWARRAGLKTMESRNLAGGEKSASDAVMSIFDLRNKAVGYAEYMEMDEQVLQGHVASKMSELSDEDKLGISGVQQVVAAGYARASSDTIEPISDQTARFLRFGMKSSGFMPTIDDNVPDDKRAVEIGKAIGSDIATNAGPGVLGKQPGAKKTPKTKENLLDKEVKYLELRAMLHGKSRQRVAVANERRGEVNSLYQQAYHNYHQLDILKKQSPKGKGTDYSEVAVRTAGEAHQKLARVGIIVEKMRMEKQKVYEESQRFRKYVGERAMSKTKRRLKQLGGMVGGIGLRVLTGGLYRVEAEQRAGGYRTAVKSKTLLEDITKKVAELSILMKGLQSNHGMNKHAMRSYIFFKALSFALQVVRDIASGIALWLGITVVGSPVGAAFATLAFYVGAAKLAIDLMLLVQASIARAKTNDPLSRILLANQQSTMAAEVGSGAGAMGAAGLMMGLSGSTGLLRGQVQQAAFGNDTKLGNVSQFSNLKGLDSSVKGMEPVRILANQVTLGPTIGGSVPGIVTSDESHKANMARYGEMGEKQRSATKAVKVIFHPFKSGIKRLHEFATKTKMSKAKQMATLGEQVYQHISPIRSQIDDVAPNNPAQHDEQENVNV